MKEVNVGSDLERASDVATIFEENFDYVWGTLRRLGVGPSDVEDLAHEVFVRVHRRLGDFDYRRPLRAWLFGIALRVASEHRKLARHRREVIGLPVEPTASAPSAVECIEADEDRMLVEKALESVELDRRAVLLMHDVDEMPVPAIAEALGIPLGTGYSRLRMAREDLAAAVTRLSRQRRKRP
jgi:RNA polymerase sigma-70 factor (ECF subfamily)